MRRPLRPPSRRGPAVASVESAVPAQDAPGVAALGFSAQ